MAIILTPSFTPTAPMTAFADMVPDVSAFLPGCPSLVIERTMRKIAIDMCQRAKVWEMDTVPFTIVPGNNRVVVASPALYAEVTDITSATMVLTDGTEVPLERMGYNELRRVYPASATGQPVYYSKVSESELVLAPTPLVTADLFVKAYVRPTPTADGIETWLYSEFHRLMFHGTLHELMTMPERSWTDLKTAAYHGKQWTYLLSEAKVRVSRGYDIGSQAVQMRPFA